MRKFSTKEIIKLLDTMIGDTEPKADSAMDKVIEDNVKVLMDVTDWCLDGVYDTARNRHSQYKSQKDIGEMAHKALLVWKDFINSYAEDEI